MYRIARLFPLTLQRFNASTALLVGALVATNAIAQSPTVKPSPSLTTAAGKSSATPSPAPSAPPTRQELIDSLGEKDIQAIISLLKDNFTNPESLKEIELNRATVQGLMDRLENGVILLPAKTNTPPAAPVRFYSEILEGHIGYLRPGTLNNVNLQAMDKSLAEYAQKKVDALIIDFRSDAPSNDFATAAEFAKRFCAKGKQLFKLHKATARQDRIFSSDRDPTFQGLLTILIDGDTAEGAEAVAAAIRNCNKAMIIGQTTAGRAVEYSDMPLPGGKILRVAIAEASLPEGEQLFPRGLKPDLPVEMSILDKRQIFGASADKGMGPFIYETERPHMNEAALIAGTNPEVDAAEASQRHRERGGERPTVHDLVLQRALDLVTSLEIYQKQ